MRKQNNIDINKDTLSQMFLTANGFKDVFQGLHKTLKQLDDNYCFNQISYFDVITINASFACEIYLKLIYAYESKNFFEKHNLESIFGLLEENTRDLIIGRLGLSKYEFKDRFLIISNDFVDFRYSYEKSVSVKVLNYDFYNELLDVLQSMCRDIVEEVG